MSETSTLINAAVFHNGTRRFRNVNVDITDTQVIVKNTSSGAAISTFNIVDTAKVGEAWDAIAVDAPEGTPVFRLVCQLGCGCSGMKQYTVDESYALRHPESV